MSYVFQHTDPDGDQLFVQEHSGRLRLRTRTEDARAASDLDREAVRHLHNALGEWLHPQNLGPTPYTLQQAIADLTAAVNGAATAVRPLWNSPPAELVDAGHRPQECPGRPECAEGDPEPHDVGHPEAEGCSECGRQTFHKLDCTQRYSKPVCDRTCPADAHPASRCTMCGHLWPEHASAPVQLVGCTACGHSWQVHWSSEGCTAMLGVRTCPCPRERAAGAP